MVYKNLIHGHSVTPKPLQAVTPVTVGVKTIRTPKYSGMPAMQPVSVQDMPSTNHEPDATSQRSQRSHSQRSAFKPYKGNKEERSNSKSGAGS